VWTDEGTDNGAHYTSANNADSESDIGSDASPNTSANIGPVRVGEELREGLQR
jgi:hypothetical protein